MGFPVPGQEFGDVSSRMIGDPAEHIGEIMLRIDARSEKEWIMPPREWCMAKAQFAVLFGERFTRAMA
jgi:hypothetical protein